MSNKYTVGRMVEATVALNNSSGSVASGVYLPAGAIVTGLKVFAPGAVTKAGASATVIAKVGATNLGPSWTVSDLPGASVISTWSLSPAAGVYIGTSGEFNISLQASSNAGATGTYNFYIDYIIPAT